MSRMWRTPSEIGTIRQMTVEDLAPVLAIEQASSTQPWTEGVFRTELAEAGSRRYWVAILDGVVEGFCGLIEMVDEGHISNIAVAPHRRRSGVAQALLGAAFEYGSERKLRAVTLEVRASNLAAQRLYHRFGLAPVAIRPRYYRDNDEDAVIMSVDLDVDR